MSSAKPMASVSLDLDNLWSYQKTHGDSGWESFPSYLDVVVPRVLDVLARRRLEITFFIVGQDAALDVNRAALSAISAAGHEIANHSFRHEPWLHLYDEAELTAEIADAEQAIEEATGQRPVGFRGPGFSLSATALEVLVARGYHYDASTFPTWIGPLARAFYFRSARLTAEERAQREGLFGAFGEGRRPLRPYRWVVDGGTITEIPVTTMPGGRLPIHVSYLLYLSGVSPAAARHYFGAALGLCRRSGVAPSLLLHPLDFLGADDVSQLAFFPGMSRNGEDKARETGGFLDQLGRRFDICTMGRHAAAAAAGDLRDVVARQHLRGSSRAA